MFGGGSASAYDDIVTKTTDENLTTENWELILNLCDKVNDEGQEGAHEVLVALLKRLAHRNPNVQLYTLTLAEALSKNCGIEMHRELASRAWTGGLERVVVDRNTHEKVRRRILSLIAMWTAEFEKDPTLGVMEDCYNGLQTKGYKFETPSEPPPPAIDDEIRRKEEEELQRVLEMSMQDRGGRGAWSGTSGDAYSSASGYVGGYVASGSASGSGNRTNGHASGSGSGYASASGSGSGSGGGHPSYTSSSSIYSGASSMGQSITTPRTSTPSIAADTGTGITSDSSSTETQPSSPLNMNAAGIVTRVKALHAFQPTEPGELAFEKGDVIKVVDRGYRDWWRGQLRGRTGIFPVNYVEALPEPTPTELAKEAEAEAAVFAQAINVEKLLTLLRGFDNTKGNLADDEEIQELYRSSMALRPKIVKLIDKYSQKRADLVSMNETFLRARNIFDRMMEDSLARHTGGASVLVLLPAHFPRGFLYEV
ncbi:hypothetical protein K435DRAFT_667261 [Dendrothele bispora CBS 962.96]|uniref:Class E vacuolar protein-sorting machinery protein HSE1 n=1 Tax=Dendrothele bispora (strain CBS 962.96) TaxID=1314807 RepID=A0A4S8LZ34_DENBC|nr:hypothetical protein K435DRAFT_667261 [Dendrothele bispora CBS 962.96]